MSWHLPRPSSALLLALLTLASGVFAQGGERTLVVAPSQRLPGETRTALVIGNGTYTNGPLRNPVNDARAMGKALGGAGFEVILVENATQAGMQRAIRTFGDKISKGGVGLFYYAGHGLQTRGRNYLIPVNADIAREYEIEFGSIDVNLVLAMMDTAKNSLNIVILDACRNNPFQRNFRGLQTGLAQIDAPTGTFIAFATAPGSVAADGSGDNGVYTKHLLAEMTQPGVPIELMFKQVRNGVMAETKGQQIPWESSSLRGEFVFRPGTAPSVAEAVAAALKRERDAQQAEVQKLQAALDRQQKEGAVTEALKRERDAQQAELQRLQAALERQQKEVAATEALKRERDAQQAEMQKLQAALERQQKQLEALGLRPPAPPTVAPPEPVKPVVTASAAPTSVAAATRRVPRLGDVFTYRLLQPQRHEQPKAVYTADVKAVSNEAVLEQITTTGTAPLEWAHTRGPYVVNLGVSVFSPYLAAFEQPVSLPMVAAASNLDPSTCQPGWTCRVSASVTGRERVTVPAGTFDTLRVSIEQSWAGGMPQSSMGGRTLTVWYSPEVARAVKFRNREWVSRGFGMTGNFDLELLSYTVTDKREREAPQADLQKLQAALARQQTQVEALGLRPSPPAPGVASPEPVKPVVTASAVPTPVAAANRRLPQPGDTWTYRLSEPRRTDGPTQRSYEAKVTAASQSGILEQYTLEGSPSEEWAHTAGGYVVALGKSLFAPYMDALGEIYPGSLGRVQIADPACSGAYICQASARATRREKVRTAAGEFDAIRVEVEQNWQPVTLSGQFAAQQAGGRMLTVWYAPAVKRAVKYSSRPTFGSLPPIDTYFDLELTSYKVQ